MFLFSPKPFVSTLRSTEFKERFTASSRKRKLFFQCLVRWSWQECVVSEAWITVHSDLVGGPFLRRIRETDHRDNTLNAIRFWCRSWLYSDEFALDSKKKKFCAFRMIWRKEDVIKKRVRVWRSLGSAQYCLIQASKNPRERTAPGRKSSIWTKSSITRDLKSPAHITENNLEQRERWKFFRQWSYWSLFGVRSGSPCMPIQSYISVS